jgi:hypothetical protein
MLRFVVLLWMAAFLLFTTFITFVFFGSPGVALKLALFSLKSTNGLVVEIARSEVNPSTNTSWPRVCFQRRWALQTAYRRPNKIIDLLR